jgi:hypothetical protein
MTPEEVLAAAVRPLIRNDEQPIPEPVQQPKPTVQPIVRVEQKNIKVKIVGRSQYMSDMLNPE